MSPKALMIPKRRWLELTWQDFVGADTSRWIAVLPVTAVEQHGPHLPLGVDCYIAEAYLARVIEALPATVPACFLPLQVIGKSDEHLAFPGTASLPAEAAVAAWTALGEAVQRAGLRKLVIVSSHGGNTPVVDIVARDLRARLQMLVVCTAWARFGYPEGLFPEAELRHGIHAGDVETSIMLATRPDLVRKDLAETFTPATVAMTQRFKWLRADRPAGFGWMAQDLNASGAIGDAAAASAEKGEAALAHGAAAFVELLADVHKFDADWLEDGPLA